MHVVDEYVDDGWSGTNFDRPDFKRMMNDVDSGKITALSPRTCPGLDGNISRWTTIWSSSFQSGEYAISP